ncbi:hypothetical protein [Variovorax sp.]|uniref:hypothetical protein n=1 Tax=Variovorax sp. TaxID=1871043 RepID=UPI002D52A198|nr:hypothetical protein [Variovorax sp.]HYP85581.1 hypothetical protein [Variovorax sp.]
MGRFNCFAGGHMPADPRECVRQIIACDDARPSQPYEHAATLAAGAGLLLCALMVPHRTTAVVHAALGGALLLRAASGRDGLRKWSGAEGARPPVDPAPAAATAADAPPAEAGNLGL